MTVVILDVAGHGWTCRRDEVGRIAPLPCAAAGDDARLGTSRRRRWSPAGCCNDSVLQTMAGDAFARTRRRQFRALGDPTEGALVIAGYTWSAQGRRVPADREIP
jgi:hypothetical protein